MEDCLDHYKNKVLNMDALSLLKLLPENSIDTIITDPPYGIFFVGKKWDSELPEPEVFQELLRVAKPGANFLCFGGARTFHRLFCRIEDSGWTLRDCLVWLYGQGFPKGIDIGKSIDNLRGLKRKVYGSVKEGKDRILFKRKSDTQLSEPACKESQQWDKWNTSLKPAWEPICVAVKPTEGTYAQNALEHGVAGFNIGNTYLECDSELESARKRFTDDKQYLTCGRYPSNLLLDERAATMLGGPSRFFFTAKATQKERDAGNDDCGNIHPTVKPLKLMEYLCKLTATPTKGIVLDCFAGSFTTALACRNVDRDFICCDISKEYCDIGKKRLSLGPLFRGIR